MKESSGGSGRITDADFVWQHYYLASIAVPRNTLPACGGRPSATTPASITASPVTTTLARLQRASEIFIAELHSYTYTVVMKNITLSVDEDVLATVRRHAAERNSTVNALVREYLTGLAAHEDRAKRARARLRQLSEQSQGRLGKKTWTREGLHER